MRVLLTLAAVSILFSFRNQQHNGTLHVHVKGTKAGKGVVYGSIFKGSDGWPHMHTKAFRTFKVIPADGVTHLTLRNLPYGEYAIIALVDADDNRKMSFNRLGIPVERYGASNDARNRFSPPSYEDAVFSITQPEVKIGFEVK